MQKQVRQDRTGKEPEQGAPGQSRHEAMLHRNSTFEKCLVFCLYCNQSNLSQFFFLLYSFVFPPLRCHPLEPLGRPTSNGQDKKHKFNYDKQSGNSRHAHDWEPAAGTISRGIPVPPLRFKCNITLGFLPASFLCVCLRRRKEGT